MDNVDVKSVKDSNSYSNYLELDKLLNTQNPVTGKHENTAHEELLFIIVHQAYELWFKQILHELDSVLSILQQDYLDERYLTTIVERCERIKKIQNLINQQIDVMQTMTPMDFLNFRKYLGTASGFQSFQFRSLELKCGRIFPNLKFVCQGFTLEETNKFMQTASNRSLFDVANNWLENMPFLKYQDFDFWQEYKKSTTKMLQAEMELVKADNYLSTEEKVIKQKSLAETLPTFAEFLNPNSYDSDKWSCRFSKKALLSALFIFSYRKEPILYLPYAFLSSLMDIDENLTIWRQKHVMMVQRMIGGKMGTGGSSGHQYLQSTVEKGRIFSDLFNLSNFLIPASTLPRLPIELQRQLDFRFSV